MSGWGKLSQVDASGFPSRRRRKACDFDSSMGPIAAFEPKAMGYSEFDFRPLFAIVDGCPEARKFFSTLEATQPAAAKKSPDLQGKMKYWTFNDSYD